MVETCKRCFTCDLCGYSTSREYNLTVHKRKHTGEKPYACKFCDYRASTKSILTRHIMTHTKEKPFACGLCDYRSSTKFCLIRHNRIHTDEKPYVCDYCDYRAREKASIKKHMRIHTGEKPYECKFCDYRARHLNSLKNHMLSHKENNNDSGNKISLKRKFSESHSSEREKKRVRFSVECKENDGVSDENSRFEKVVCILFVKRDCDLVVKTLEETALQLDSVLTFNSLYEKSINLIHRIEQIGGSPILYHGGGKGIKLNKSHLEALKWLETLLKCHLEIKNEILLATIVEFT